MARISSKSWSLREMSVEYSPGSGNHGGPLTTTLAPWKCLSLPALSWKRRTWGGWEDTEEREIGRRGEESIDPRPWSAGFCSMCGGESKCRSTRELVRSSYWGVSHRQMAE